MADGGFKRRGRTILATLGVVVVGAAIATGGDGSDDTVATAEADASTTTLSERATEATVEAAAPATTERPTPTTTAAPASATTASTASFGVRSITDGDTFVLSDGRRVRLAQVDAPETNECFGSESTAALRTLIDGRQVMLRRPPTGPEKDRYGRTLADVLVDGKSVNEALVATGAAEWYESYASEDADLARRLEAAEANAKHARLGLWAACATAAPAPAPPVTSPPVTQALVPQTSQPANSPPPSSSSGGNCHPAYPDDCIPPAPPDLDCPDIRKRVRVDHAYGDPHRLDANKDGWGCESYG